MSPDPSALSSISSIYYKRLPKFSQLHFRRVPRPRTDRSAAECSLSFFLGVLVVNFRLSERKRGLAELPRHQDTKNTKFVRDCWVIGPAC
jgi:hypothetical protein